MYIKPVLSDHLSYVTIFQSSLERSHKTGLTVYNDNLILLYFATVRNFSRNFPFKLTQLPKDGTLKSLPWTSENIGLIPLLVKY